MNIDKLLRETNMTLDEIAESYDITLREVKDATSMTLTEVVARDTQIMVYDVLGYDGTDVRDICARCSIIMLRPGCGIPEGWGHHQSRVGNVCLACMNHIWDRDKRKVIKLLKHGCFNCSDDMVKIYFYNRGRSGTEDVFLYKSLPACRNCKEIFYEEKEDVVGAIRRFHLELGDSVSELFPSECGRDLPVQDMLLGTS